ncbi:MAG TPA: DNA methyltransferase [Candidatus Bathyarchaeia archaeon]|nr:DNA methyltransferase [Candidatus Bathyarchaeia archaeon]
MLEHRSSPQNTGKAEPRENKLNELSGTEWIKFTKSWFIHRPKPRGDQKIRHPASFPESLVAEFITFFTKKGQLVVDPFLGTGSTLVASLETDRNGIGFEIVEKYADISRKRVEEALSSKRGRSLLTGEQIPWAEVVRGDSKQLSKMWEEKHLPLADYCITSPPYWNQLKRNHIRQKERVEKGLDTVYSTDPEDIGNLDDYQEFLTQMKVVFDEVHKIMKPNGYLTVVTNNVFFESRMYPLAFDTVSTLSKPPYGWVPKDEKVWLQDDKALLPLGVFNAWVGNRHHQYCLIFRKEDHSE